MNERTTWRRALALAGAAVTAAMLDLGTAAQAGDGPAAGAPAAAKHRQDASSGLWGEVLGAAMAGWIREPEAAVEGVPLGTWLERLASDDEEEAEKARRVFRDLGRDAYPWIAVGLGSRAYPAIQGPCAEIAASLPAMSEGDAAAAVTDPRVWMRRVALAAARRGGLTEEARREALGDDDEAVRREASLGFLLAPPATPETLAALEAALSDTAVGVRAPVALALLRAGGPAAARFATALERPENREQFPATCLRGLPTEAGDAILPLLASPSWHVRSHGVTALALAGTISERAVHAIADALGDASGDVRWRAACALDRSEARGTEAALRARLSDPTPDVRAAAAVALATLGATPGEAVPPLVAALAAAPPSIEVGNLRPFYAEALGPRWYLAVLGVLPAERIAAALGRHGASGVAALRPAAKTATASARRWAVAAYDAAGAAGGDALLESLTDPDEGVRRAAAVALARRGDGRVEVVEALARRLSFDPFTNGHSERLDALLSLGLGALPSVRALLGKIDDRDLRPGLCAALVALGERAAPAVPEVLLLSPDEYDSLPYEQQRSSGALFEKAIRSMGAAGLPGLVAAIRSDDATARERAFRACLLLGPAAKPALPAMREALAAKRIPGWEDTPADAPIRPIEE